jgi:cation transport ATPase
MFVTIATVIVAIGHEYVAAAVLMTIILIAEFIAEMNTGCARAEIRALIGSVPRSAIVRTHGTERTVLVEELRVGDVVLVRGGERMPVDGSIVHGQATVNEAAITGESLPVDKDVGASVLAGTVVESGALDVRAERLGQDTTFARIIALVSNAEEGAPPVQKLRRQGRGMADPRRFRLDRRLSAHARSAEDRHSLIFTSQASSGLRHRWA